jgi:hypothetical protein
MKKKKKEKRKKIHILKEEEKKNILIKGFPLFSWKRTFTNNRN